MKKMLLMSILLMLATQTYAADYSINISILQVWVYGALGESLLALAAFSPIYGFKHPETPQEGTINLTRLGSVVSVLIMLTALNLALSDNTFWFWIIPPIIIGAIIGFIKK